MQHGKQDVTSYGLRLITLSNYITMDVQVFVTELNGITGKFPDF